MESGGNLAFIQKQEWLLPAEEGVQNAVNQAYESGGAAAKKVQNALNGVWLGHPLHPVLVGIPIGAWTSAVILDLIEEVTGSRKLNAGADAAIAVGIAGAVASAATGLTDWKDLQGAPRRTGIVHGIFNVVGLALFAASLAQRRRGSRASGRALAVAGLAVTGFTGWLGGHLVYRDKVGVDHSAVIDPPRDFTAVLAEADLSEGQMRRVEHNGFRVLLAKKDGRLHAIGETCSHLGGPLSEGKLDGDCVVCPWHGSVFSLKDGSVADGPATHPQPCFDARVRDGQIEIRLKEASPTQ